MGSTGRGAGLAVTGLPLPLPRQRGATGCGPSMKRLPRGTFSGCTSLATVSVPDAARGWPSSACVASVIGTAAGLPSAATCQASADTLASNGAKPADTRRSSLRVSPPESVTSAVMANVNTGALSFGTERSGLAGNVIVNAPLASVTAVPRAIRAASPPNGSPGKNQRHHGGNRTSRSTRQRTFAFATARPV